MREWQRGLAALAAALFIMLAATAAQAERRVALVIGMSKYQNVPALKNPRNDARLMADTLKALGFTLVGGDAQFDLDKAGFDRAIRSFGRDIKGADVALFYYAGHGLQTGGTNWLVPVTADPGSRQDLDFETIDAQLVITQMEGSGARLNLVILDACRNNPFGGRGIRASGGGLAQMQAPRGTLISYATQPGNVALDGDDGNSPFTKALAQEMRRPGLDVLRLFNAVGNDVSQVTAGRQQPWLSSSPIEGDFYFAGATTTTVTPPTPPAAGSAFDPRQMELVFWEQVRDSRNPALLQAYLDQYPQGTFAALARLKLAELKAPSPQQQQQAALNASKSRQGCAWSTRDDLVAVIHSAHWVGSGPEGSANFGGPANGNNYAFYRVGLTGLRLQVRPDGNAFSASLEALATESTMSNIGVIPPNTHRFQQRQFQASADGGIRIEFDGDPRNGPQTAATFSGNLNQQCQLRGEVTIKRVDFAPPFDWVVIIPVTLSKAN